MPTRLLTFCKLTDLRAVLHVISEFVSSAEEPLKIEAESMSSLQRLADRTSDTLTELQEFIDGKLVKKIGVNDRGKPYLSKRAWLKHESKARNFRERLRDCRVSISLQLSLISTRSV